MHKPKKTGIGHNKQFGKSPTFKALTIHSISIK
jgi:hypothetical protein